MAFAIMRARKLKTVGAVSRSAQHTFRELPTPNADPSRSSQNLTVGGKNTDQVLEALRSRLPTKRRKDAVLCIEYLITASPEAFKRHGGNLDDLGDGYFKDALNWLRKRHGTDNVLSSTIHLDESTPHLVAYVVPRTKDGRLSAKGFLGGPQKLRDMQDSFHLACAAKRGLARGIRGSKAKHEDVRQFYTTLREAGEAPKLTAKDYAAKAVGLETEAWKRAATLAKANAQGVTLETKRRKASRSRKKALDNDTEKLLARQMVITEKEIQLRAKANEIEQRSQSLTAREKEIRAAENKLLALEAEKASLERRLGILQPAPLMEKRVTPRPAVKPEAAPRWGER